MRILIWLLICLPGVAQVIIEPMPPHSQPGRMAPLQLRDLNLKVEVKDHVVTTQVDHVFYNPGGQWREGTFLFPLPPGAHLKDFSMWIAGKEMPAELLDAEKAHRIYTDIVRSMKDPALLQYTGGPLLKARIFPIEGRSEKRVRLTYQHVLARDGNLDRYIWPLQGCRLGAGKVGHFAVDLSIETTRPLQTAYSPTFPFQVVRSGDHKARLSYETSNLYPDRDLEVLISSSGDGLGADLLTHTRGGERFFWLTLMPRLNAGNHVDRDLVFAVDCSGSMSGKKMDQARAALRFCIENLNETDRFQLVRFSTEAGVLSASWMEMNESNRRKALDYIDGLRPMGGTNMGDALQRVAQLPRDKNRARYLILLSDGKPTIGERDEQRLLNMLGESDWRVFPFGIGYEINTHLLDKMAENGRGWRTYVNPEEDLELKLSSLYTKIQSPVLSKPRILARGVVLDEMHPKRMPDLFQGNPLHVFGTYTGQGPARIVLEGEVNGRTKTYEFEVAFARNSAENGFIPGLWAQRRVGFLLDQIRLNGQDRELIDEVVRLAREYGIVTPYTSYLILEDEAPMAEGRPQPTGRFEDAYQRMQQKSGRGGVQASRDVQEMAQSASIPEKKDKRAGGCVTHLVAGRAFYQEGETWVDSMLPRVRTSKQLKLEFGSKAYFQFLKDHPELKEIFALGSNVRFLFEGTLVRIEP